MPLSENRRDRPALVAPPEAGGNEPHFLKKLRREESESIVRQPGRCGRPRDGASLDGPDLGHHVRDLGRQLPSPHEIPNTISAHNVNHEMFAKAYRRGLRVAVGKSFRANSLNFLFGSHRQYVVDK
jgi:hypothetical protein